MTRGNAGRASVVWLVLGVTAGSLAALAIVVLTLNVFGSNASAAAAAPPHFVEEAAAAGVHHVYDGDFTFFVGGGVAAFDCDDDGQPDLYFAGGTNPAALYRNESPVGGALRFAQVPDPATDLTAWSSAPTRSTSTETGTSTLPSCGSARTCCCVASATAGSSGATRPGGTTAATPGRRRSAPSGRARRCCRRSRSATTST